MSAASRKLDVGARVTTDFSKRITTHTIITRMAPATSQSGVLYKVSPPVPGAGDDAWIDADWFEPAREQGVLL